MATPLWLHCDAELDVPTEVAVCPFCQARLIASMTSCRQAADGTWLAASVQCRCAGIPDLDDDEELQAWWDAHNTTHADMAPVEAEVLAWLNVHYHFRFGSYDRDL